MLRDLPTLLPTPTVQDGENVAAPSQMNRNSHPLNALVRLLPTPTVMDMGANYTPEEWQAWKDKQKAAHENGNGHGASLTQEALALLPTPRAQNGEGRNQSIWARPIDQPQNLENAIALLPTPMLLGTPTAAMTHQSARGISKNPNPRELAAQVAQGIPIGANIRLPSTAGSTSSDESHPLPLFQVAPDEHG
jgi:hypothetical protein